MKILGKVNHNDYYIQITNYSIVIIPWNLRNLCNLRILCNLCNLRILRNLRIVPIPMKMAGDSRHIGYYRSKTWRAEPYFRIKIGGKIGY